MKTGHFNTLFISSRAGLKNLFKQSNQLKKGQKLDTHTFYQFKSWPQEFIYTIKSIKKRTKTSDDDFSNNTIERLLNKLFLSKSGICKAQDVRAHVRFERNSVSPLPHSLFSPSSSISPFNNETTYHH